MFPFKRIVFPVDYSETCRASVPYVDGMTKHFSAQLTVVRAYSNTDWLKQVEDREDLQLREFVAEAFPSRHVDAFLEECEPVRAIEKVARKQAADLVMIPIHSFEPAGIYAGILKSTTALLDSLTAKVLHDVSLAVWTGTHRALKGHPRDIACKSILCAVEFSGEIEAVLRAAAALACSYNAGLTLVHVVEASKPDLIDAASERLDNWKRKLAITAPHKVLCGATAASVCREAVQEDADLIVTGRGLSQTALTRLLSELYTIVRDAPCPVLSI